MDAKTNTDTTEFDAYAKLVAEKSPYLFCDNCQYYPIEPKTAQWAVSVGTREPSLLTKCCEGGPLDV